jgi:hypothetical protein
MNVMRGAWCVVRSERKTQNAKRTTANEVSI